MRYRHNDEFLDPDISISSLDLDLNVSCILLCNILSRLDLISHNSMLDYY